MRAPDLWSSASSSSGSPSPPIHNNRQLPHTDPGDDGSANQETTEVFRSVFKGRKCWKTQKGGEMVWPPELEAALLEGKLFSRPRLETVKRDFTSGLAKYQPDNSRETVLLGR